MNDNYVLQKLKSEGITVYLKKSFSDYIFDFLFFIFRCVFICFIPFIILFLLNFSFLDFSKKINTSINYDKIPYYSEYNLFNDYLSSLDNLIK